MATRRERVVLELEDNFTKKITEAAMATALLKREVNSLSGSAVKSMSRDIDSAAKSTERLGKSSEASGKQIDRLSGRMRLLAEAAVILGPGLVPIGAAAIPMLSGLAMGMTAAAAAAGTAVLAFQGVGDALKSLDAYQLSPTTANLEKMQIAMDKVGPAGAQFVHFVSSLEPQLSALQNIARGGLFPGVEDGMRSLLTLMPQVSQIVANISKEMGNLAADAGKGLSGAGFASFFNYLQTDAASTLANFAHAIGNVAEGLANLMVAFAPLSRDFSGGMEAMSASFARWSAGLSKTQGFQDFLAYIRESGPQVLALIGSLATALAGIVRAAAPMGQIIVPALTAMLNVLSAIANSPIGPALYGGVAAMLAIGRATSLASAGMIKFGASTEAATLASSKLGGALKIAGLALAGMALTDSVQKQFEGLSTGLEGVTQQILTLSSSGGAKKMSGDFKDLGDSFSRLADPNMAQALQDNIYNTFGFLGSDSNVDKAKAQIDAIDSALTNIASTQGAGTARRSFESLAKSMGLSGAEQQKLLGMLPKYRDALAGTANANARQATSLNRVADAAGNTRSQLNGLVTAMEEQKTAALNAFSAETQYRQALKAAAKQARDNKAGIQGNSAAALKNRDALSTLAGAWNNQSKAVKNSESKYQAARAALISTAVQMGVARDRAEQLANRILDIPKSHVTQISLTGSDEALNKLAQIRSIAASIPRSISTTYYVNQVNALNKGPVPGPATANADGGTVPRTGLPYADRHHYLLADGEEVISNRHGQADRNRSLLKAINAGHLADGGTASRYASASYGGRGGAGAGVVQHVVRVEVRGEMDLNRAKAQIRAIASEVGRGEVDADRSYRGTLSRQGVS